MSDVWAQHVKPQETILWQVSVPPQRYTRMLIAFLIAGSLLWGFIHLLPRGATLDIACPGHEQRRSEQAYRCPEAYYARMVLLPAFSVFAVYGAAKLIALRVGLLRRHYMLTSERLMVLTTGVLTVLRERRWQIGIDIRSRGRWIFRTIWLSDATGRALVIAPGMTELEAFYLAAAARKDSVA